MSSPVVRSQRNQAIVLLRGLAAGKISNDQFEDRWAQLRQLKQPDKPEDIALEAVRTWVWGLYSDLYEHRLAGKYALSCEGKQALARVILFLRSDRVYEWQTVRMYSPLYPFMRLFRFLFRRKPREEITWQIWPFRTQAQLDEEIATKRREPQIAQIHAESF